jgi:hypothetical protein
MPISLRIGDVADVIGQLDAVDDVWPSGAFQAVNGADEGRLAEPDGPQMATTSPFLTVMVMPFNT